MFSSNGRTAARLMSTAAKASTPTPAPYIFSKTALIAPRTKIENPPPHEKLVKGVGLMAYLHKTLYTPEKAKMMEGLFSKRSPTCLRVGSIVTVTNEQAPTTFTGVLIGIRRRGPDSSILLRNILQRTGLEMQFFPNAPGVKEVKVIKPPPNGRMRRAKLFYLRDSPDKMTQLAGAKNK